MLGAIMQPYFFPYIGYYQLAYEVDTFIFLDDVNFIRRGFINRNTVMLGSMAHRFTIPVAQASQNRLINQHEYTGKFDDFLMLVEHAYKKSPYFADIMPLIEKVITTSDPNVARKNADTIEIVFKYLGIKRHFAFSSELAIPGNPGGQARILNICERVGITDYRNAIGGSALYDKQEFASRGINLAFVKTQPLKGLDTDAESGSLPSIIDALMNHSKQRVIDMLGAYSVE